MDKRTIPVCCTTEQYEAIAEFAKASGMTDAGQALEKLLTESS